MDIISAYREVGTYRGAAAISGTTPKTVKRVIVGHESGQARRARAPREHNDGWSPACTAPTGTASGSAGDGAGSVSTATLWSPLMVSR